VVTFPAVAVEDPALLLRAIEVYELDRLDFAEAYLVACAERSGVNAVASFDKSIRRVTTMTLVQP
jgi:predicted nucleic-acid-binding protein